MSEVLLQTEILGDEAGRAVVLIHGWPLSRKSWSNQIGPLVDAGYKVVSYDRRGFGESDKPESGYDYDTFADDLNGILTKNNLHDVTLVGFSMGGGEIARYVGKYGEDMLHSVVFASAIPPALLKSDVNPDGPLDQASASGMQQKLQEDSSAFYDQFTKDFFSANGDGNVLVSEEVRQDALNEAHMADPTAALESMKAWGTDFRDDLSKVTVPTLVIHGDSDGTVPFDGSGKRTHEAISHSELHVIAGGPHGVNASHANEFNKALLEFLSK